MLQSVYRKGWRLSKPSNFRSRKNETTLLCTLWSSSYREILVGLQVEARWPWLLAICHSKSSRILGGEPLINHMLCILRLLRLDALGQISKDSMHSWKYLCSRNAYETQVGIEVRWMVVMMNFQFKLQTDQAAYWPESLCHSWAGLPFSLIFHIDKTMHNRTLDDLESESSLPGRQPGYRLCRQYSFQ